MLKSKLRILMAREKLDDIIDVMRITGLSRESIRKLYREKDMESIKLGTLLIICDAFNCTLSELIEYVPDKKSK